MAPYVGFSFPVNILYLAILYWYIMYPLSWFEDAWYRASTIKCPYDFGGIKFVFPSCFVQIINK